MRNKRIKTFILALILSITLFGTSNLSIANIKPNKTVKAQIAGEPIKIYEQWENESNKEKILQPFLYSTKIEDKDNTITSILSKIKLGNSQIPEAYVLSDEIDIEIKNQMNTEECWAFATTTMIETNLAKTKNQNIVLSPRHIDYSTARTFLDGINTKGFNREVGEGGNFNISLAYCTNGQGPVLESDMPFENNYNKIYLNEINKNAVLKVNDYVSFPSVYKYYDFFGNVTYTDGDEEIYTRQQVLNVRNQIKEHIMNYGAVSAHMYLSSSDLNNYINNENGIVTYYNHDNTKRVNHGVCIIGWNDNFPKELFKDQPSNDGAYLVLNSANGNVGELSLMAVSYEDEWIEFANYGIVETGEIDYDKIYQYDEYGYSMPLVLTDENDNTVRTGYTSNVFSRTKKSNEDEYLNEVSITISKTSNVDIYINAKNDNKNDRVKVKSAGTLEPGYHTIHFDNPIKLTGEKFVVVAKLTSSDYVSFATETNTLTNGIASSYWDYATSSEGESYISTDGTNWDDLNASIRDSNICIKAFSTITEKDYMIGDIDEDGEITLIDISLINQAYVGKTPLTENGSKAADIDGNGEFNLVDISLLNQIYVGKIPI